MDHFSQQNLLSPFQTAYRRSHSVETTITHVSSSIKDWSMSPGFSRLSQLVSSIRYNVKLKSIRFGILGTPLKLLRLYLMDWTSCVKIHSSLSDSCLVQQLDVQSVWAAVKWRCWVPPVCGWHPVLGGFPPGGESYATENITRCFKVVKDFMWKHCLKLKSNKTHLQIFCSCWHWTSCFGWPKNY